MPTPAPDSHSDPTVDRPPAADIAGAIAQTERAIEQLTDPARFEQIAVTCLQEFAPTLRRTGGAGDEQRDAVGGVLRVDDDRLVVTVSLERDAWGRKIERDLDGLIGHGHHPDDVWAVTSRPTGAARRTQLEREAPGRWGVRLRIFDVRFLAQRLLTPDLLWAREELLRLPPPTPPIAVDPATFVGRQPDIGAPPQLVGRDDDLTLLRSALQHAPAVELSGPGGIGKTRLALEAIQRVGADRVLLVDDRVALDSDRLAAELAGRDWLLFVIDNAHRRSDLRQVVGQVANRPGLTTLLLVTRPGFAERMRDAIHQTRFDRPEGPESVVLSALSSAQIGDLVRSAEPHLEYRGAVEEIVRLAQGSPLIALLAHQLATRRGGLHGLSRGEVLGEYAESAIATAVERRVDVDRDDLLDLLDVLAALGAVDGSDRGDGMLQRLLDLPERTVQNRLNDLLDVGLLVDSGGQLGLTPDLLAAHVLRRSYFSDRRPPVSYAKIWQAGDEQQRDRMCAALGGLQSFALDDRAELGSFLVGELGRGWPERAGKALERALLLAPGLPLVAVEVIDRLLDGRPTQRQCRLAMDILSRVGDIEVGWSRQLAVAQRAFSLQDAQADVRGIRNELTGVYKRLPIEQSAYDWQVLARVQDVLESVTASYWSRHRGEPGAAETISAAAGQLLKVVSDRSQLSAENDREVKLSAAFLPAGDRTKRALETGSRLLRECLEQLPAASRRAALAPLGDLRRTADGLPGLYGAVPSDQLQKLAADVIGHNVEAYGQLGSLDTVGRLQVGDALGQDPWPADGDVAAVRLLFGLASAPEDPTREDRLLAATRRLEIADDPGSELERWQAWLDAMAEAGINHTGRYIISQSLARAAARSAVVRPALVGVLSQDGTLNTVASVAVGRLLGLDGGEQAAAALLDDASPVRRAMVARALEHCGDSWADELLGRLTLDSDESVRAAVASAAGWTEGATDVRILSGLRACLPADVVSASGLAQGLQARGAELPAEAAVVIDLLALGAAELERMDAEELVALLTATGRARQALPACLARLAWLERQPGDFEALLARDALPDELVTLVVEQGREGDAQSLLDLLQRSSSEEVAGACAVVLARLEVDADVVSDRIAQWLADDHAGLERAAVRVLEETRDQAQYLRRARRLLAVESPLGLSGMLIDARQPRWTMGSQRTAYETVAAEFRQWTADPDPRVAEVGRAGDAHFSKQAVEAAGRGEDLGPDTEFG